MRCERGEGSRWELWPLGIGLADTVETHQLDVKVSSSLWHPPLLHRYSLFPWAPAAGAKPRLKSQSHQIPQQLSSNCEKPKESKRLPKE